MNYKTDRTAKEKRLFVDGYDQDIDWRLTKQQSIGITGCFSMTYLITTCHPLVLASENVTLFKVFYDNNCLAI